MCERAWDEETGETGEVGDGAEGATKRNAGTCFGLVGAESVLVLARREECVCGREKFVAECSWVVGAMEELVELDRDTVLFWVVESSREGGAVLRACGQAVVQIVFECPQA